MKRKKSKRKSPASILETRSEKRDRSTVERSGGDAAPTSPSQPTAPTSDSAARPSLRIRTVLTVWLCMHLPAILISFTGGVEPSTIHAQLSNLTHIYLRPAHFSADDRPVYLAHGNPSEQPHRVQVTTELVSDIDLVETHRWQTAGPDGAAGLAVSDRVWRWLSTAVMVGENDQPGLVAELLMPIVQQNPDVTAVRIVRLPFPADLTGINEETESPYVARVVRRDNGVSLVRLESARLSSQAVKPNANRQEGSGDE